MVGRLPREGHRIPWYGDRVWLCPSALVQAACQNLYLLGHRYAESFQCYQTPPHHHAVSTVSLHDVLPDSSISSLQVSMESFINLI